MAKNLSKPKKGWGRDISHFAVDDLRKAGSAGSSFEARAWGGDRGNVKLPMGMKGQRAAPKKPSKAQEHSERGYRGRTDYGVTDARPGGFANHTDDHDPRAKSYHEQSGVGGGGFQFKGARGY